MVRNGFSNHSRSSDGVFGSYVVVLEEDSRRLSGGRILTHSCEGGLLIHLRFASSAIDQCYLTSMVVTLNAGSVRVNDKPLAGIVPMETGCTAVCPSAEAAVI